MKEPVDNNAVHAEIHIRDKKPFFKHKSINTRQLIQLSKDSGILQEKEKDITSNLYQWAHVGHSSFSAEHLGKSQIKAWMWRERRDDYNLQLVSKADIKIQRAFLEGWSVAQKKTFLRF